MSDDKTRAYNHFRTRCRQRFGIVLNFRQIREIGKLCHDGSYFKICDQREGVALYRVPMGKKMAAVAYDKRHETVLSIIPIYWTSHAYRNEREQALREDQEARESAEQILNEQVDQTFIKLEGEVEALKKIDEDNKAQVKDQEIQMQMLEAQFSGEC